MKKTIALVATIALCWSNQVVAHPGGLDANGGHTNRKTGEYHKHGTASQETKTGTTGDCAERPKHNSKLDVVWAREHGHVAPYTCRTFASVKDVDIEHIVAFAEAKRSGLTCAQAGAFVNDMLNITVAFPKLNRHQKSDKDIADWRPPRNACWFAARVKAVKEKYGLTMDARERQALEGVLAGCTDANQQSWQC